MTRIFGLIAIAALVAFSAADVRAQTDKTPPSTREQILSPAELQRLTTEAKTPADHARLSDYYLKSADRHEQEAAEYDSLAKSYSAHTGAQRSARRASAAWVQGAQHCRNLAAMAQKAAREDRALASLHARAATEDNTR